MSRDQIWARNTKNIPHPSDVHNNLTRAKAIPLKQNKLVNINLVEGAALNIHDL